MTQYSRGFYYENLSMHLDRVDKQSLYEVKVSAPFPGAE
jgi:hypothetical protein